MTLKDTLMILGAIIALLAIIAGLFIWAGLNEPPERPEEPPTYFVPDPPDPLREQQLVK